MADAKMEKYFSFIKDCLLKFNYPLAHSMSDEELGEIFKAANRCFLINWILKLMDSIYEEILEHAENDKEFLGNIVHELGFCAKRERLPFMTGELPVSEQVKIIFNMFTFVSDIKRSETEQRNDVVTNEELADLKNRNLNLFPMYGDIKVIKSTERCDKLLELRKEVDSIKISTENETEIVGIVNYKFSHLVEEFLIKLKADFPKIAAVIKTITKDQNVNKKHIFQLYSNSSELMRECSENIRIISQFVRDIVIVRGFLETNVKINELTEEIADETAEMIQTLYQEILSVRKYARCL